MEIERVTARKTVFDGKIFEAVVMKADTAHGEAEREVVYHSGGSCVLAFNAEGKIGLVKQYRIAKGEFLYELPAGKIEEGESPAACAARELREELGWEAETLDKLATIYPTPGYSSEAIHIFMTKQIRECEQDLDEGEELEVILMPFEEALEKVLDGEIKDGKTVVGILKASVLMQREQAENAG